MKSYVSIDQSIRDDVLEAIGSTPRTVFAKEHDIPYNLLKKIISGEAKTAQKSTLETITNKSYIPSTVDAELTKLMGNVWGYIHDMSRTQVAKDFDLDVRVLSGERQKVDYSTHLTFLKEFKKQGLNNKEIREWHDEMSQTRIPYSEIKPLVDTLKKIPGINPARLINHTRYESGEYETVSPNVAERLRRIVDDWESLNSPTEKQNFSLPVRKTGKRIPYSSAKYKMKFLNKQGVPYKQFFSHSRTKLEQGIQKTIKPEIAEKIEKEFKQYTPLFEDLKGILSQRINNLEDSQLLMNYTLFEHVPQVAGIPKRDFMTYSIVYYADLKEHGIKTNDGLMIKNEYITTIIRRIDERKK